MFTPCIKIYLLHSLRLRHVRAFCIGYAIRTIFLVTTDATSGIPTSSTTTKVEWSIQTFPVVSNRPAVYRTEQACFSGNFSSNPDTLQLQPQPGSYLASVRVRTTPIFARIPERSRVFFNIFDGYFRSNFYSGLTISFGFVTFGTLWCADLGDVDFLSFEDCLMCALGDFWFSIYLKVSGIIIIYFFK